MAVERLNALSAAFLTVEDVDPAATMVIGSVGILEGPAPTTSELAALIADRLHLAPRYRQRVQRMPLDLLAPVWRDVDDLDLADHVRRVAVPTPGGRRELTDAIGWIMGGRLDRAHPLWDVWLLEGLADDRWALVCRLHHTLADGVSGTELMQVVYDGLELRSRPAPPEHAPSVLTALEHRLEETAAVATGGLALGTALLPVHGTDLTGRIGSTRGYAWSQVQISTSARVRHLLGVTLNDLALASVAGGYRELLRHHGEEPDARSMRSLVPVSGWSAAHPEGPDNRVTLMLAQLPVEIEDPLARVRAVHQRIALLRRAGEPLAGLALQRLAGWTPYALVSRATRVGLRLPQLQVATVTTNVPGPRTPLTCLGRPVHDLLPYVPIADRVRTGVAMLSYCDAFTFGVTTDLDSTPDAELLAGAIARAWSDVVEAARAA